MLALHIILYVLLGTSLAFAVIELGISAYVTTGYSGDNQVYSWDPYQGYVYSTVHVNPPGILIFILFNCCWTMLVSAAALVLPWYYTRKGFVSQKLNTTLGVSTIVVYFVTSVFWLASFADVVAQLDGFAWSDYASAVVAFAVLLWLLFLALFILAILAVCGVMVADWAGYQSMKKGAADPEQPQTSTVPPPANDVPMSTAPAPVPAPVAASELSHRDAEAFHNQPHTSATYSPYSPPSSTSGIASAELSGDSNAHYHQYSGRP